MLSNHERQRERRRSALLECVRTPQVPMPATDETVAETTQQPATLGTSALGGMSVLEQLLRHQQPAPVPVDGLRSYGWSPDTSSVAPVCEGALLQTKTKRNGGPRLPFPLVLWPLEIHSLDIRYEPGALLSSGMKELIEISILVARQVGRGTSRCLAVHRLFGLVKVW